MSEGVVRITDRGGREFCIRIFVHQETESLVITEKLDDKIIVFRADITLNITERSQMTTTVLELLENLKHCPGATKLNVKDVDDEEWAIVDFQSGDDGVTIVIGEKVESEPDEEEI
ncbi:MAG: hypothetical protein V7K77_14575 [Nostoc sp.]|uniref:hypothetical protein n=1 Tax=Nostoc sp. TaxID=1180 RepID=UPI002FFB8793